GEFRFTQQVDEQFLFDEISRIKPSELLVAERAAALREQLQKTFPAVHLTVLADSFFSDMAARRIVEEKVAGASHWQARIRGASAVIGYLQSNTAGPALAVEVFGSFAAFR